MIFVFCWLLQAQFFARMLEYYVATIAELSGVFSNWFGQGNEVTGSTIWSVRAGITVARECSGMKSIALLFALVLCFPAPSFARA